MAHLKDLLVAGPSRFIGEVAFNDVVTLNETLILAKNPQDAQGIEAAYPALIIGDTGNAGAHLALDGNEIMAKATATTTADLYINYHGGNIKFGGSVQPVNTTSVDLGSSSLKWRTLYVGNGTDATSTSTGVIQATGGIAATKAGYFGGKVTADSLKITSTASGVNHIEFSRDYNYFKGPASSTFIFLANGKDAGSSADGDLLITDGYVYPGTTEVTTLGKSDKRWTNVYTKALNASGNATVSGNATISGNITVSGTAAITKDTTIGNGTASTSMTTGALKVTGGVGVTGQLNAKTVRIDNAAYFQYNSTDKCIDVIFG